MVYNVKIYKKISVYNIQRGWSTGSGGICERESWDTPKHGKRAGLTVRLCGLLG